MTRQSESGFTIIEVLVATLVFAVVSIGFYQVMISSVRGSETTQNVARISEEARAGFNRIVRDAREADSLDAASPTSFTIWVDYDADTTRDYTSNEYIRYRYDATTDSIMLAALDASSNVIDPPGEQTLVENVQQVDGTIDIFDYQSNRLEYDHINYDGDPTPDGITTWEEIDNPPAGVFGVGDRDGNLDSAELTFLSSIVIRFNVQIGTGTCANPDDEGACTEFYGEAQLRNRRFSI